MRLLNSIELPPRPNQIVVAEVEWQGVKGTVPLLLEAEPTVHETCGIQNAGVLLREPGTGRARVVLTSELGFTKNLYVGTKIGHAPPVYCVECQPTGSEQGEREVAAVSCEMFYLTTEVTNQREVSFYPCWRSIIELSVLGKMTVGRQT